MFGFLKRRSEAAARSRHAVPDKLRVYAIGDIHGCRAELDRMLDVIAAECASAGVPAHLVFLGDLVDRGPDSSGVLERLSSGPLPGLHQSFLMGNHEEAMLQVWDGHGEVIPGWLRFGGVQTLESYGLSRAEIFKLGIDLPKRMREVVPLRHIDFLRRMTDQVRIGDYLFVHAGIRPGLPFHEQEPNDLRWIREEFLSDQSDHGAIVVHGHTISDGPELRPNRIGIDTGCYASGRLTALVLERTERRFLQTGKRAVAV
jgi:serine/threonine protein phosphatase 1